MRMSLPRGFSPLMVLWRGRWVLWHLGVLGTPPNELRNGPGSSGDLLGAASDAFPEGPNVSRLQLNVPLRNGIASLLRGTGEEGNQWHGTEIRGVCTGKGNRSQRSLDSNILSLPWSE